MNITMDPKDQKRRRLFLEGNIMKGVLSVCLPMAFFQFINEMFRVVDLLITSQISPESVSAVSFFNQLANSVASVGNGLSIGAGILIAGYYGAGNYQLLKKTVNTVFCLVGIAAVALASILIFASDWVLKLANTPADMVDIGLNYYRVVMLNLIFQFINNVYIAVEKARGNGPKIMRINFLIAAVKFVLSALFVLVLKQGIVMVAVATLMANGLVTIICMINLRHSEDVFGLSFRYVCLRWSFVKRILEISLPVIAEKFAFSAGKVVVNSVGVEYGTQTVGALGVSNSVSALSTMPAASIGDGGAALIRQNIGNQNPDRALQVFRSVFLVDVVWGTAGFLLTWMCLDPLLHIFARGDEAFATLIKEVFLLEMASNVFLAVHAAVMALLYAFGHTRLTFLINFSRLFVVRIPLLFFLKCCTSLPGGTAMGLVMMLSNAATGILSLIIAALVLNKEFGAGWMKKLRAGSV